MYVNGTQVGTDFNATGLSLTNLNAPLYIGNFQNTYTMAFKGYIDDYEISKGIARNPTPPTSAIVGDVYTVLLLHMDGADGSTTFTDDSGSGSTSVTIPSSLDGYPVIALADNSMDNEGLISVTAPTSLITLGNNALSNNANLQTLTLNTVNTVTFGTDILSGCTPTPKGTIFGYNSSVRTWASGYSTYYNYNDLGYEPGKESVFNGRTFKRKFSSCKSCLLYTSPSPRDTERSRMPSSA